MLGGQKDPNAEKKMILEEMARSNAMCINCGEFVPISILHDLSYYNVIANFKQKRIEEGIRKNTIPPIIQKVYPDLQFEKYKTLKADLNWLQERVRVCEDCYLDITAALLEAPARLKAKHDGAKIKASVKPKSFPNADVLLERERPEKYISKELIGSYRELHKMFSEEKQHRNEDTSMRRLSHNVRCRGKCDVRLARTPPRDKRHAGPADFLAPWKVSEQLPIRRLGPSQVR